MPTYRAPNKDEAEKIRSNGFDPAGVVVDDRTGDVYGANDVPGPDYLTENLKSFVRAVPTVVTGPLRLGGAAADAVRQLTGEYNINDPSALTQSADWIERKAAEFAPQDPRANGLATIPGQVVGQIAGVLGGSKLASMLGSRALSSMAGNAIGQSAAMTAGDTVQEEMDRQAREEITQDPARALAKGLVTGGGTALLESGLGVGKFLRSLDEPAGTTLGNVLKRAGMSAASEAGQEAGQMAIVEGEPLPEGIGMRALAGAIGGGVAGGAQGLALPTAATKTKPAAGVSGKDMAAASKTQAADTAQQLTLLDDTTRQALLLSQRTGQKYEPGISSPHIKAATDLIDLGVPLDGIREGQTESALDRIAKAKPADLPLLSKQLYDEHFLANPISQETTVKLVAERTRELEKLESQLDKLRNRQKKLQDEQVKAAARGPGPEWMARNDATIQNELAWIDQEGNRLVAQKEMLLGQIPPKPVAETGVASGMNEVAVNLPPRGPIADTTSEVAVVQPQQIQPAPTWVRPSEVEQRLPFGQSVSPGSVSGTRPAPESPVQIAAQIQLTVDPASTKKATLITPGSAFDYSEVQLPMVRTPHGIVFYNPQKTSEAEVIAGTSGDVADGSLFGYGPGQTSGEAGSLAVDTTVAGTPGVLSQVVRNENEAQAAVAAQQAAAPGGETQVKPAEQVIAERQSTMLPGRALLKRFTDEAQTLANRTYILSGLSELNKDRPYGLTPNKDGEIFVQSLRARMAQMVPKAEIAEYERNGLNDWFGDRRTVGVRELADWIQANGPRVEFLEIRPQVSDSASREVARLEHQLDTEYPNWRTLEMSEAEWRAHGVREPRFAELIRLRGDAERHIGQSFDTTTDDATIGRYGVEPRPSEELVNPVEGLVKVPAPANKDVSVLVDVFGSTDIGNAAGEQWTGGHHGKSGQNALGFFRASEETLPDGRKGLHLFEVQSDWGSIDKVRNGRNKGKYQTSDGEFHETFAAAEQHNAARHPLLPEYNRLVLKSAIKYAADRGLDFVAVSDAETAMMTEKHHQVAGMVRPIDLAELERNIPEGRASSFYGDDWTQGNYVQLGRNDYPLRLDKPENNVRNHNVDLAKELVQAGYGNLKPGDDPVAMPIPQEPGMRKNYDELLPNILQNLTGSAPEPVTFAGEHGNYSSETPAFNNKKTISARAFDISLPKQAFAADEAYSLFGSDRLSPAAAKYRSALLPGEDLWNDLKKSFRQNHAFNDETILTAGPAALYDFAQSSLGRMARDNPLRTYGAVVANKMFIDRNATMGRKERELEPLKPFLQDDRAKKWINDSTDTQTWDVSKLPADLQPLGAEFVKFHKSFLDETIALGQHVMDPVTGRSRLPIEIPGHFPYTIKPEFYQELAEGGPRADYWTDVWVKSYQAQTGDYTPAGKKRAEEALRLQIGPMSNITIIGGEPIFLAFRRVHGINIPTEMRDDNLLGAYENYIDRYAQDRAWTVHVQDDPLARRAFGATTDKQFNKVDDSEVEPNETQWEDILQAARRYNSPWLSRVQPGMNLGTGVSQDSPEALAFIQSFIQRPLQAQTQGARIVQAGNALASSALMQTTSGIRDASAGLAMGAEYVDMSKMAKNTVSVLADYAAARDNALQSGAMQSDVFRHQAAGVIGKGMYRAIRGFRTLTGRQIMDQYPRVVLHATAYEQVLADLNSGNESPLANEFCTATTRAKGSNDEIARETAANIVERVAPSYDARNLPPGLVPQTANWLGHMLGLARWGVARYANWYEDTLRPALRHGDMSRLIKSLFTGLLGSAATGVLIELLRDKKPANLTWQEWLKLDSEDQIKQAAPLFLSLYQVNGTFGLAGDMMLPVVNAAAGTEPLRVESAEPLMPVMIVGKRLAETVVSFKNYAGQKNWNLDSEDLADLSVELMSNMQLFRDLRGWTLDEQTKAEKELGREVNLYQRLEGRSAKTGNQREIPRLPVFNEPFTLSKEFNNRDIRGLRSLVPALVERAERGESLPAVMQNEYKDEFWLDVAKRRGIGATKKLYKANEVEKEEDEVRKELLQELKSLAPNRE